MATQPIPTLDDMDMNFCQLVNRRIELKPIDNIGLQYLLGKNYEGLELFDSLDKDVWVEKRTNMLISKKYGSSHSPINQGLLAENTIVTTNIGSLGEIDDRLQYDNTKLTFIRDANAYIVIRENVYLNITFVPPDVSAITATLHHRVYNASNVLISDTITAVGYANYSSYIVKGMDDRPVTVVCATQQSIELHGDILFRLNHGEYSVWTLTLENFGNRIATATGYREHQEIYESYAVTQIK